MSNHLLRPLAALASVVCLCLAAEAQSVSNSAFGTAIVNGELRCDEPTAFSGYRIEMTAFENRGDVYRFDVHFDGTFQLIDVPPGSYMLNVLTLGGGLVQHQIVNISPLAGPLILNIPGHKNPAGAPGTVSVKQLLRPPSRQAVRAAASAARFSEKGENEKAAAELEKAIQLSPDYAAAYNNLGVQHIRMGRYEDACAEISKALEIAGPQAQMLSNLAIAQRSSGHFLEAAESARAALNLDKGSAPAHLVLGSILVARPDTWSEGIRHLEIAAKTIKSAQAALDHARELHAAR